MSAPAHDSGAGADVDAAMGAHASSPRAASTMPPAEGTSRDIFSTPSRPMAISKPGSAAHGRSRDGSARARKGVLFDDKLSLEEDILGPGKSYGTDEDAKRVHQRLFGDLDSPQRHGAAEPPSPARTGPLAPSAPETRGTPTPPHLAVVMDTLHLGDGAAPLSPATASEHACDVYSWGHASLSQLGHPGERDALLSSNDLQSTPLQIAALRGVAVRRVQCGAFCSAVLTASGQLYTFGNGKHGELGHGEMRAEPVPRLVAALAHEVVQQVACGSAHMVVLTSSNRVYAWGSGKNGRLGRGNERPSATPVHVAFFAQRGVVLSRIACGDGHTVGVSLKGRVYSWGSNSHGQLGHSQDVSDGVFSPHGVDVLSRHHIVSVACGSVYTVVISETHDVFAWGVLAEVTLPRGQQPHIARQPVRVLAFVNKFVRHVAVGREHALALTVAGDVYAWGDNQCGQCGVTGDSGDGLATPTLVPAMQGRGVRRVAAGSTHSVALTDAGEVFVWGNNRMSQLAVHNHGIPIPLVMTPRMLRDFDGDFVRDIACGAGHTVCLVDEQMPATGRVLFRLLARLREFARHMTILLQDFKFPLVETAAHNKPIVSPKDIDTIFQNTEIMLAHTMGLLRELDFAMDEWVSPWYIVHILIDKLVLDEYHAFIDKYVMAAITLYRYYHTARRREHSPFSAFLQSRRAKLEDDMVVVNDTDTDAWALVDSNEKTKLLELRYLHSEPIRFLAALDMLLTEWADLDAECEPLLAPLRTALGEATERAQHTYHAGENACVFEELRSLYAGFDDLAVHGRELVRQGECLEWMASEPRPAPEASSMPSLRKSNSLGMRMLRAFRDKGPARVLLRDRSSSDAAPPDGDGDDHHPDGGGGGGGGIDLGSPARTGSPMGGGDAGGTGGGADALATGRVHKMTMLLFNDVLVTVRRNRKDVVFPLALTWLQDVESVGELRHAFHLVAPEQSRILRFENEKTMQMWARTIRLAISKVARVPEGVRRASDAADDALPLRTGTYKYTDGSSYTGSFAVGKRHGEGTYQYANNMVFVGEWDHNAKKQGTLFSKDSLFKYDGAWAGDQPHGQGMCIYENGEKYDGEWHAGQRQGEGEHCFTNGDLYNGAWLHDTIHGVGIMIHNSTGDKYEGSWRDGRHHGSGVLTYGNGDVYRGSFVSGAREGKGALAYANGDTFEGYFKRDKKSGFGMFSRVDGTQMQGHYVNDALRGRGALILPNGDRIIGDFMESAGGGKVLVRGTYTPNPSRKPVGARWDAFVAKVAYEDANKAVRRVDEEWLVRVVENNRDLQLVEQHVGAILRTSSHPYGHLMADFVELFIGAYTQVSESAQLVILNAVDDVQSFVDSCHKSLLSHFSVLSTPDRSDVTMVSLCDCTFEYVYPTLFRLYTTASADKDAALDTCIRALQLESPDTYGMNRAFWGLGESDAADATAEHPMVAAHRKQRAAAARDGGGSGGADGDSAVRDLTDGTPRWREYHGPYERPVAMLREMCITPTPRKKISSLVGVLHAVSADVKRYSNQDIFLAADDLIPILVYVLVQAEPFALYAQYACIDDFLSDSEIKGEVGCYITHLRIAMGYIGSFDATTRKFEHS